MTDAHRPSPRAADPPPADLEEEYEWIGGEWREAPPMPPWRAITALLLSIAGFGVSLYLLIEHYTGSTTLSCPAAAGFNCQRVTTGPWSEVFGIPVVWPGVLFFVAMVVINLPGLWRTTVQWVIWLRVVLVTAGMAFVLLLIYRELFEAKAICVWCTVVHVITFLLFVLVLISLPAMLGPRPADEELTG